LNKKLAALWLLVLMTVTTVAVTKERGGITSVLISDSKDPIVCGEPKPASHFMTRIQCYFADRAPYVPAGMTIAPNPDTGNPGRYPMTFQMPASPRPGKTLKLELFLHDQDALSTGSSPCESDAALDTEYLQIRNCAGGYPAPQGYTVGNVSPAGWWGPYGGHVKAEAASNAAGERLAQSLNYVITRYGKSIDGRAGIKLTGTGSGGTGAILQSLALPDPRWQQRISIVEAQLPCTLFVEDALPDDAAAQLAWGNTDTNALDFRKGAAAYSPIHRCLSGCAFVADPTGVYVVECESMGRARAL
jgi:hypothetical protein